MSGRRRRLDKLYPTLTPRERALAVLKAWKEDREPDAEVISTMPEQQAKEFNRLLGLMERASGDLTHYVVILHLLVGQLDLRHAWLATFYLWGLHAASLGGYFTLDSDEPVTESEHKRLVRQARSEMLCVGEIAETLCLDEDGGPESEAAWRRRLREKRREMARLVEEGVLVGRGKGRGLRINAGSFYQWRGEPVPVVPDWGRACEVYPDSRAEEVRRMQDARRHAQQILQQAPIGLAIDPLPGGLLTRDKEAPERSADDIARALMENLQDGVALRWRELQAVDTVLEEAGRNLDGEDLLYPEVRLILDESREKVRELHDGLEQYGRAPELQEPSPEQVEQVRQILRRDSER